MKYSNNDIEFCTVAEIKAYQEQRLQEAIAYLSEHSPFYQRMFRENDIDVTSIKTMKDLEKLPFTEKKDLQLHNDEFLCVPKDKIIDYITTSGTLGDPVTFGCTDKDLDRLA
jgi:phenylacetate-CoA ligase